MKNSASTLEIRIASVLCAIGAAILIGCGGSGGGVAGTSTGTSGGTTTSTTTGTTTATTTGTTTATTTGTTTATTTGTSGSIPGFLPANKILYSENNGSVPQLKAINADGTGATVVANFPINVIAAVQDPNVSNQFFFAAGNVSGSGGPYQVFKGNSTLSTAGATLVSTQTYDYIADLDITPDGTTLIYSAAQSDTDPLHIWKVAVTGGTPVSLDLGTAFALAPNGSKLAYAKDDAGTTNRIYVRGYANSDTPVAVTSGIQVSSVAWSRASDKILFSDQVGSDPRDLFSVAPTGGTVTKVTDTINLSEESATYSPDSSKIAYLATASDAFPTAPGIYVASPNGASAVQILASNSVNFESIYWTNAQGRVGQRGLKFSLGAKRRPNRSNR